VAGSAERTARHTPRPELGVLGAALLFGTTGTAQALGPDLTSPATVGAARLVVGGAALALIAVASGGLAAGRGRLRPRATVLAAAGVALYQVTFFAAVARTGVALGTVVALGSAPAATGALALVLRRERPGPRWGLATILAVAGCALIVLPGGDAGANGLGVALALAAGASYALYTVASKELLDAGAAPTAVMGAAFGLAAVPAVALLALGDSDWLGSAGGLALAAYLGLVPTALAYTLFARGLRHLASARVATLTLAEPLAAAGLGVLVLSERPSLLAALGGLAVLSGLVLVATAPRRQ